MEKVSDHPIFISEKHPPSRPSTRRRTLAILAAFGSLTAMSFSEAVAYPAAYFNEVVMKVDRNDCAQFAADALTKSGEKDVKREEWGATGTTPSTRGFVVCVALPKAGACGRDGATAVIVTAGDDADKLRDLIFSNFRNPVPIDCG